MEPESIEINKKIIVGLELKDAGKMSAYILYIWVKLCPCFKEIKNIVDSDILYGVWYRSGNSDPWHYLVGVEVNKQTEIPESMVRLCIPTKYVKHTVTGHIGQVPRGWQMLKEWSKEHNLTEGASPTFEKYNTNQPITGNYQVELFRPKK